jgi:hypothetical protein
MRLKKPTCTQTIQSKELSSAAWGCTRRAESVGLHDTLAHDVSEYVKQSQRAACAGEGHLYGVPPAATDCRESAVLYRTEGTADNHYLQLADQMLKPGKHKMIDQQRGPALCEHIRPGNINKHHE